MFTSPLAVLSDKQSFSGRFVEPPENRRFSMESKFARIWFQGELEILPNSETHATGLIYARERSEQHHKQDQMFSRR